MLLQKPFHRFLRFQYRCLQKQLGDVGWTGARKVELPLHAEGENQVLTDRGS